MLFKAAIDGGFTWLAIVAVASSVISVWFYLGVVVKMYFNESHTEQEEPKVGLAGLTLAICVAGVVLLGVIPSLITGLIGGW